VDEFFKRVANRTGTDRSRATAQVRALFQVLGEAIASGDLDDCRPQLPKDFHALMQPDKKPSA
jgi:uncharacterized protein (DUF2267 family)